MINFGDIICVKRKAKGLSQKMLARRVGMTSVQLCKIEKKRSSPTLETVERLAEALEISLSDLFAEDLSEAANPSAEADAACRFTASRFVGIRYGGLVDDFEMPLIDDIARREEGIFALHKVVGIPYSTMLPLVHSFKLDYSGAVATARYMRSACAAGQCAFSDLAEMLEFRNVRIHLLSLPIDEQSRSYYDIENRSLSIVLSKGDTSERHVYRLAYELAWAVMFGSFGYKPVKATALRHRFARDFASEFLMPEESVRFAVSQLGIRPNDWTLSSVAWLKSKFNVSAEAFALRLESLGLISERLRQKIRDELREYYKTHPRAMEPKPALPPLKVGMRRKLLEIAAAKRGVGE